MRPRLHSGMLSGEEPVRGHAAARIGEDEPSFRWGPPENTKPMTRAPSPEKTNPVDPGGHPGE